MPYFFTHPAAPLSIDMSFNTKVIHQTIEGFGGGFMFGVWPYGHHDKQELYDSIFNEAGCAIVRIGNVYDPARFSLTTVSGKTVAISETATPVHVGFLSALQPYVPVAAGVYFLSISSSRKVVTVRIIIH